METLFSRHSRGILIGLILAAGFIFAYGPPFAFAEEPGAQAPIEQGTISSEGNLISMDFQDVPFKQLLKVFSQQAGMNFVASENIQDKKVTLYLDRVTVEDALNTILGANGFAFEKKEGINIFMVKDAGVSTIALQTKIFKLSYATVSGADIAGAGSSGQGIETVLQNLLSPNGKIVVDSRTNSLLVTDIPSSLILIEEVLKELDVKTQQVMISAEIMEVSVDTLKRLGIEWGSSTGQFMTYGAGTRSTYWPFKTGLFKGVTETATIGSVNFSSLSAVVQAIKTDANTQYLARPRLLTLNNRTAEMTITKNAAVSTTTVTISQGGSPQTTTALERYEVGTMLKVTPHINKDNYVTLTIEPEVSRVKASAFGTGNFDPLKRSSKATVMVKDGETILIAGLISREDSDSNRKVPILGEVPILGQAFNRDERMRADTEILIFITTNIIREEGVALAAAMSQELGLFDNVMGPREGGFLERDPLEARKGRKGLKQRGNEFHKLVREQDSPLSGKELMIEAEVLKVKSAAAPAHN